MHTVFSAFNIPSPKCLSTGTFKRLFLRVGSDMALEMLEPAKSLLAVFARQRLGFLTVDLAVRPNGRTLDRWDWHHVDERTTFLRFAMGVRKSGERWR